MALHAGEHPVRMAAGPFRIRTLLADGAGLGGQGVGLRPLVPEEAVDLPGDLLMVRPGLQGPLQIRDVRHLAHGGQQQGPGVGQAPGPALLHRAHGGGTGPAGAVAGAVGLTHRPHPLGEGEGGGFKKFILDNGQLPQLLLQQDAVYHSGPSSQQRFRQAKISCRRGIARPEGTVRSPQIPARPSVSRIRSTWSTTSRTFTCCPVQRSRT